MSAVAPSPAGSGKGLQLFAPINQIAPAELVPSSPDVQAAADNAVYNPAVPAAVGDAEAQETTAWLLINGDPSMPEAYGTVPTQTGANVPWWRKIMGFVGPGVMISVGYMDPGNWSTDIAGGSAFGYDLLFIVLLSSLIAMFLQVLAVRVGFATGRDLAQCCRDVYPKWLVYILWVCMEIAILCCDLAEVIGAAVALKLLFGLPLIGGVWLTSADVILLLFATGSHFRVLECFVALLVLVIVASFAAPIGLSRPDSLAVMRGFVPSANLYTVPGELFIAAGIVGATIMPHNLFLHTSLVLTRNVDRNDVKAVRAAIRYSTVDTVVALLFALFVNAAILIVAASTFNVNGYTNIATLEDAYHLLDPILGTTAASTVFAVALLCSGQNSTLTGTLAGQVIMEGFVTWKIKPLYRRLVTRLLAIAPAVVAVSVGGDALVNKLLILSQVVLSAALPLAMFPLVHIASTKRFMGPHVSAWPLAMFSVVVAVALTGLIIFSFTVPSTDDAHL